MFIPALFVPFLALVTMLFTPGFTVFFTMLFAPGFTVLFAPHFAVLFVVPVAVVARGHAHQAWGDAAAFHPAEVVAGRTGAIPAGGTPAPGPAAIEEHFLVDALHHLDAGLDDHEPRDRGQAQIDVDIHLRTGHRGTHEKQESDWQRKFIQGGLPLKTSST